MPDVVFGTKNAAETIAKQEAINRKAKELGEAYKQAEREARTLDKAVERIFKSKKPAEQFNKEVGLIAKNFADGKISAQEYERQMRKLESAYDGANKLGNKLKNTVGDTFSAKVLSFARGWLGILTSGGTALGLITAEIRAQRDLLDKAQETKLSVSETRNVVLRNLPGASRAVQEGILGENAALAGDLQISERYINLARAEALSASGGNRAASLDAVGVAAKFLADKPEEIGGFAGSLLDLSKVTGTTDANTNLGLLTTVAGISRVTSPRAQAQNIAPALIGMREFGATTSEGASLFSALTTSSGDLLGAHSGTASIQLARQLSEFTAISGTMGEKIKQLQQNRDLAETFLSGATFEAKSLGPIRSLLLNANSDAAKEYAKNLGAIPDNAGLARQGVSSLDFGANRLNAGAETGRSLASLREGLELQSRDTLSAQQREDLKAILTTTSGTSLGTKGKLLLRQLGDNNFTLDRDDAIELLSAEAAHLSRAPTTRSVSAGVGGGGYISTDAPSEADKKTAKALEQAVEILREIAKSQERTAAASEEGGLSAGPG